MRLAILSDAHANHLALETCLSYLFEREEIDRYFFLGDAVGYYTEPNRVIDILRGARATCLLGNHDAMACAKLPTSSDHEEITQSVRTGESLTSDNLQFLATLEPSTELTLSGKRIYLAHGSPFDELEGYVYPDSDLTAFEPLPFDVFLLGHTHHPFIRKAGDKTIVNVGSCGMPRDHGGLASCAIYDSKTGEVEIVRIPLDVGSIIAHFESSVHPQVLSLLDRVPETCVGRPVRV